MQFWHLNRLSTICSMTIPGGWMGERGMLIYYVNQLLQVRNNKNCLQRVKPFTSIAFAPVAAELHALKRVCNLYSEARCKGAQLLISSHVPWHSCDHYHHHHHQAKKLSPIQISTLASANNFFFLFVQRSFWWHHFTLSTTKKQMKECLPTPDDVPGIMNTVTCTTISHSNTGLQQV